jgi:Flp pilus assembly protein TadB
MNSHTVLMSALGALCGCGVYVSALALTDVRRPPPPDQPADGAPVLAERGWSRLDAGPRPVRRTAVALSVGAGAAWWTGWPVAVLLGAAAAWYLPVLLGPDRAGRTRVERLEAVAGWTEQLRDTLAAASGLEQAMQATAVYAPLPIRPAVTALAARLDEGAPLTDALEQLAADLKDPLADLVVIALINASDRQVGSLGDLLAALAATAREQARMQIKAAASRAQVRTAVRMIVATTLSLVLGLVTFVPTFTAPYSSALGQLVLLSVGALFAVSFTYLARLARFRANPRMLAAGRVGTSAEVLG